MTDHTSNPELSVIVTVYKNKEMLEELHNRLCQVLENSGIDFEIIFVDDVCPQGSLDILRAIAANDRRVNIVVMEHNVGQQKAVLAGINNADGEAVVIMDGDLQDPPEAVPELFHKLQSGYDLVFAGRRGKYEESIRLLTSRLYKWTMHLLIGIPVDAGLFLMTKASLAKNLLTMNIPHPHIPAMLGVQTKRVISIPVERQKRPSGQSTYTSWMRLRMGLRAALWAFGWRLGLRTGSQETYQYFAVKHRIGQKFNNKAMGEFYENR